eukprot:10489-Eustigmatos_ZCMA.PRE.1
MSGSRPCSCCDRHGRGRQDAVSDGVDWSDLERVERVWRQARDGVLLDFRRLRAIIYQHGRGALLKRLS